MTEWRPIESAPKNKTKIWGFDKEHGQLVAVYLAGVRPHERSGWYWETDDCLVPVNPTHYMPLPAPPVKEEDIKEE